MKDTPQTEAAALPTPSTAQLVDVPNPQRGGSYARDPVTGALTLIVPPTADLNTTAPAEE